MTTKTLSENEIQDLSDRDFYDLFDLVIGEHKQRKEKAQLKIFLNLPKNTQLIINDLKGDVKVRELKSIVEETFFDFDGKTIPGPSARCEYCLDQHEPIDNDAAISRYADRENIVYIYVYPPKK